MCGPVRFSPLNNRAFTLLELIVVMVLIALTISFAVPQISNFLYTDQLKVAARKLVGLIGESSQLAQRRQMPYLLKYIDRERRFVVEPEQKEEDNKDIKKERELRLAESVTVRDLWSWYGGTHPPDEFAIRFNKNGYVEPTVIHLRDTGGQELSVLLPPFLGKIQIIDSYVIPDQGTFIQ
jgi:prepilin-type N-terminal cleavage/methylation domain-containing protein